MPQVLREGNTSKWKGEDHSHTAFSALCVGRLLTTTLAEAHHVLAHPLVIKCDSQDSLAVLCRQVMAKKLFRRLESLGAHPLAPLGLGDDQHPAGYEATLDPWVLGMWPAARTVSVKLCACNTWHAMCCLLQVVVCIDSGPTRPIIIRMT